MSESTNAQDLLAAALHGAADVARARLGRDVSVVEVEGVGSTAILRFDLTFANSGKLCWYVSNEDATGFSDMLIGGAGDRAAVLTEMHLDALTVAFSDMLTRAVDSLVAGLDEPLQAGEIDLGMEAELPAADPNGARVVRALEIAAFGPFTIVQQADQELTRFLEMHALDTGAAPASAGPAPVAQPAAPAEPADNVVPLPGAAAPAAAAAAPAPAARERNAERDLDLLMNVPLPITVELGQTQRTIRELVDFSIGSIIELGKLAGDPLDIKVNDRTIARGEVVVIDEEFGIRVTEIVSPQERLEGLG
jgi:flagellar motor switch protein FliN/FliY